MREKATSPAGGDVVLLVCPGVLQTPSLQRAYAIARTLGARLHVLCVLQPILPRTDTPSARRSPTANIVGGLQRARAVETELRLWVEAVVVQAAIVGQPPVRIRVRMGELIETAARSMRHLSVRAIVVPPSAVPSGPHVRSLERRVGAPVTRGRAAVRSERFVPAPAPAAAEHDPPPRSRPR